MSRSALIGAALALLMTSTAFAQTNPPGEPLGGAAPPPPELNVQPPPAPGPSGGEDADRGPMGGAEAGRDWPGPRRDGDRRGWRGRYADADHHGRRHHLGGPHGWRGDREGAFFRFRSGEEDGPTLAIQCADRDTTQACVEAIMPMLDRLLDDE